MEAKNTTILRIVLKNRKKHNIIKMKSMIFNNMKALLSYLTYIRSIPNSGLLF